jgi:hypothetical protein
MLDIELGGVQENQEFTKLLPGGYVCGITKINNVAEKQYLEVEYDIAEGVLKNYFYNLNKAMSFWGGKFIKSYKQAALPFFKGFITAVENSNKDYKWDKDETKLTRKLVGLVLGEEEYIKNDGTLKTRLYVAEIRSVDKIKKGDFKVPELKKLKDKPAASPTSSYSDNEGFMTLTDTVNDDDLPF